MKPRPWDQTHPNNWRFDSTEVRINQLTERIVLLERVMRERFGPGALGPGALELPAVDPNSLPNAHKRGPAPALSQEQLLHRRESIIDFLEFYWPELRIPFMTKSRAAIHRLLDQFATSHSAPSYQAAASELHGKVDQLIEFLNSAEWNGDPRLAASAMAGIPEIRWTTSLRYCRKLPTDSAIGIRALRDYLRRNFPLVFRSLLRVHSAEAAANAMSTTRTPDREFNWLRDNPEDVLTAMRIGKPGQFP